MSQPPFSRRHFLKATSAALGALVLTDPIRAGRADVPASDPTTSLGLRWTGSLRWAQVVDVTTIPGRDWDERLKRAQEELSRRGGGVAYFPEGTYAFGDHIHLLDGVILRGAEPEDGTTALDSRYSPPTRFEFPRYEPKLDGDGTPVDTAFKGIYLADPARASNCGVVHISLNRGHIHFGEAEDHRCGANRIVYGCVLRNAAVAAPDVPDLELGQKPWQRYTRWHYAAIAVHASENILIAHNRLPESTDSFPMPGYVLRARRPRDGKPTVEYDVVFDYDNRPGIDAGSCCMGAPGGEEPSGTPESHPWGFRKGTVIRHNFIYATGRNAIAFSGDGTICSDNVIRFKKDVWRQTNNGRHETSGSSTNDNRAVQMRGWRWVVERNDYEVWRNWAADHKYYINDGEGLMHENHCNSHIRDSRLVGNRGNAYLSLYKTGGIDGLLVEDNDVTVDRGLAIFVESDHDSRRRGPCRRVTIAGNRTSGGGILIAGQPASDNVVRGNRHTGKGGIIRNRANARIEGNEGYEVEG